jgi:TRAP-type transport system small permease protein
MDSNYMKVAMAANHSLVKMEEYLMSACTIILVGVIFIEVICRYFLYISSGWSEEIARYLFIWLTYIGSAYAIDGGGHIEIDILKQILGKNRNPMQREKNLKRLEFITFFTTALFLFVFNKVFFEYMLDIWKRKQASPTMHIPMGLVYLPISIGNILGIIHCIANILDLPNRNMKTCDEQEGEDL